MLSFNEKSFTVEVNTGTTPHENWRMTCMDMIDALQALDDDMRSGNNFYYLLELLRAMLPDDGMVKKMCG